MIYEEDYFTQFLGENVPGINFKTWQATTNRFTVEITKCDDPRMDTLYGVSIEEDHLDEDEESVTVLEDVWYPTLEEAKAFIDGWLAAAEYKGILS